MNKFLSIASTVAVAIGGSLTSAAAQNAGVSNPSSVIPNYDVSSIGPILNELGVAWQAQKGDDGQTFIAANVADQVNFLLAPTACRDVNQSDCVGLNMVAIFDGAANPQTVQAFNYRYAFASAGLDPSGSAYISRYEIADYGAHRGNIATSIQVFANQVVMFGAELATARRTVSLDGYADDLSASHLNRQSVTMMTGYEVLPNSPIDAHQRGFEQAAAQVKKLIANKSAPRNKINNISAAK